MKARIAVLGLGGVGGFAGAKLAAFYGPASGVEVSFLARGATLAAVRERGLRLDFLGEETLARPAGISDDPACLGVQDFLICAVKAYDLDGLVSSLRPAVGESTVIVPFLNGVEGAEKLKEAFPENIVADGCAFIVSESRAPGEIAASMERYSYMFGLPGRRSERLADLEALMRAAGLRARLAADIERVVWEKFAFISPISTLMSYVQKPYGEMAADAENMADLERLLREFCEFAAAKGADLPEGAYGSTLEKYRTLVSADFTTSMQRDFAAGRKNELETLTGYVIRKAAELGLELPCYEKYYKLLKRRG